jgi:hypothetical protein
MVAFCRQNALASCRARGGVTGAVRSTSRLFLNSFGCLLSCHVAAELAMICNFSKTLEATTKSVRKSITLFNGRRQEIAARFPFSQLNRRALRLQAQVASQARRMRLETPATPRVPRVRSPPQLASTKKNRPSDGFFISLWWRRR